MGRIVTLNWSTTKGCFLKLYFSIMFSMLFLSVVWIWVGVGILHSVTLSWLFSNFFLTAIQKLKFWSVLLFYWFLHWCFPSMCQMFYVCFSACYAIFSHLYHVFILIIFQFFLCWVLLRFHVFCESFVMRFFNVM